MVCFFHWVPQILMVDHHPHQMAILGCGYTPFSDTHLVRKVPRPAVYHADGWIKYALMKPIFDIL